MVICPSSAHMRYKCSLIPYQILAKFICKRKSNLLKCIGDSDQPDTPSFYDGNVLDGAVIVNCLLSTSVGTFHEYGDRIFIPYLEKQLELPQYWMLDSLKESTSEERR